MLCDISFEDSIQKGTGRPYGSGLLNKPQRIVFAWPLLSSDTVGTSRNPHDACSRKVWRTFCFLWAQSIPTPSANLKYNKGQEAQLRCATETTGTASVPGPCNICRSEGLSHTREIPTRNVGSTPCRRRQQLLLPQQCMLTPDSRSTKKSSSVRLQQQAGIWTWPPSSPTHQGKWITYLSPAGNQQSSWRSGKHLLLLKYWANRCDQQAAAGHWSALIEGIKKPDTTGPISQAYILSSMVTLHTFQLHLTAI